MDRIILHHLQYFEKLTLNNTQTLTDRGAPFMSLFQLINNNNNNQFFVLHSLTKLEWHVHLRRVQYRGPSAKQTLRYTNLFNKRASYCL